MTDLQSKTILELRRRRYAYADIAARVGGSANTVKSHCQRNERTLQALTHKEICKQCGAKLDQKSGVKRRSFCSDRCRYAWWTAHRDLMNRRAFYQFICPCCGKKFEAYGNDHRKYCSRKCQHAKEDRHDI